MAHIHDVQIGNTNYLIEPTLFGTAATSDSGVNYTLSISNFEYAHATGVAIQVKFPSTNAAGAKLNINSLGAKAIYYNNATLAASLLKANHTYTLVYDGTQWQLVGDIDTNTTYANGTGITIGSGNAINHSNSVTAQTTQGFYPIKIDAQGHINGYGTAITPVTSVNGHTGSSVSVTASDLGLASALKYVGAKSSLPTATDSTTYSAYNNGDVITVSNKEYAYIKGSNAAGSSWVELGDEGSYKLKQTAITKPTAVTNKWASAIGQDAQGVLTVDYASLDTSGTWSGNAATATLSKALANYYTSRPADANITHVNNGGVVHFKATSTMTSNKPMGDGSILHFYWDNAAAWNSQLYMPDASGYSMQWRGSSAAGTWDNWRTLLDSNNYTSYTVTKTGTGASGTWDISIRGNAATASKIAAKLASTTKTFLLGTSTTITGTAANVDLIGDTGVYLTTTAGQLSAKSYSINDGTNEKVRMQWNATDQSLDFIFA